MAAQADIATRLYNVLDGGDGLADAGIILHFAVFDGHIEIGTQQHMLTGELAGRQGREEFHGRV